MRLVEIVVDKRKRFARYVHEIGLTEISGREHEALAVDHRFSGRRRDRAPDDIANALGRNQLRVGPDAQLIGSYHTAIVLEGFLASGLLSRRDKRVATDLQQLGGGEESHADGIAHDRIGDGTGFDYERIDPALSR